MSEGTLLLVEKSSHRLSFYDPCDGRLQQSIDLPAFPHEIAVDAEERFAYVGHYGVQSSASTGEGGHEILVVDLRSRALIRTIDCRPYRRLHGIRLDAAGRLYALSEDRAVLLAFEDPRHAERPDRAVPVGGLKSHLFALSASGETAFCANLLSHTVTRVQPWAPLAPILACAPGSFPEGVCLSADEATLFVSNRRDDTIAAIDTATMESRGRGAVGRDPTRIYRLRDNRLAVTNYGGDSLSLLDATTLEETARLSVGAHPIALSLHPNRPQAFLSLDSNEVAVLDLEAPKVLRRFPTALEPDVSQLLRPV